MMPVLFLVGVSSSADNCSMVDSITVSDQPFVKEVLSRFGKHVPLDSVALAA